MYCSNCGNQIPNNVIFCDNCGTKQTNKSNSTNDETDSNPILIDSQLIQDERTENVSSVDSKAEAKTPIKQNLNKDEIISTLSLHLNETSSKTLKILSAISVIIFFLPIGSGWGLFCSSLSSREPSGVAVPLFVFLLTLCIIIFFKLTANKTIYKLGAILSGINVLLSLSLVLPTPYNTQYLCIGSVLVLLVSVAMFICSINAFRSVKKTESPEYCDANTYIQKEKEVSESVYKQKLILKTFALIGMIIFFFPFAVTSCQNKSYKETGLNIMNHFSSGIGNMYAIIIFGLFLLVFVTLFFQNKIFTTFSFVFGSVNIILLAMSKAVFGSYINNYLLGFYMCCVTALVLSIGGYIYYTKVRKAWGDDYFSILKTNSKSMFIAIVITVVSLIVVVVANYNINSTSVDVINSGNSSNAKPTAETTTSIPKPKYTFDEVVTKQPTYFIDGGKDFQVKSQEANYYGEITVGQRSYVEGMSATPGTYALFVADESNSKITFTFKLEGYYKTHALKGTAKNDTIVYPADAAFLAVGLTKNTMSHTGKDGGTFEDINGLRLVEAYFSQNDNLIGSNFNMLAVVISKDEAVRYAQDGTLPNCLQGLIVTGLDKIFINPENKTQVSKEAEDVIEIVTPKYGDVGCFSEGMAAVSTSLGSDGRWGFIDDSGKEVIPLQYIQVKPFSDGLAWVQAINGSWSCIDKTGKEIIPFGTYSYPRSFSNGFASVVNSDKRCGVIDTTGKVVVPLGKYTDIGPFSEGLAVVNLDNKNGIIDTTGKEVIAPVLTYSKIESFSNGMAAVLTSDNKWGFIDNTGKEIISPQYDNALSFSEGLAAVHRSGWGFVDKSGNEIIPLNNSGAIYNGESFSDGTVAVVASIDASNDRKKKVIDTKGKQIASLEKYSLVDPFVDGFATCSEGVIDKQGVLLAANLEDNYHVERSKPHAGNIIPISNNYKYGFIKIVKK